MDRVLVTGANGFIGRHLVQGLLERGLDVRTLVRPSSKSQAPQGVTPVHGDLLEHDLARAAEGCGVVYHLAGLTRAANQAEFWLANAVGAHEAARGARHVGARFVLVSSQAAAGSGTFERPRHPNDPAQPLSLYGRSKLEGERRTKLVPSLKWTIVRPSAVYGPHDQDFLFVFQAASKGFFPILGNPARGISLIHVSDLVLALFAAAERPEALGQTYFAAHPEPSSWQGILEATAAAVGRPMRGLQVPNAALWAAAQLGELTQLTGRVGLINRSRALELTAPGWVCDPSTLERDLGVRPRIALKEGFLETAQWYKQQGLI